MDEKEACQALRPQASLFVHMKWETRGKEPLLCDEDISQAAYVAVKCCVRMQRCRTFAIGGQPDHIHAIFDFPASLSISTLARLTMKASAEAVTRYLNFICGRSVSAETLWDSGYGLRTLGESELPHVIDYVQRQATLHERGQTCEKLERVMAPREPCFPRNESGMIRRQNSRLYLPNVHDGK